MDELDGSQPVSGPSEKRRAYAPGSTISMMIRLLEKDAAPVEQRPIGWLVVAGIVIAAVVLLFATLGFLAS